MTKASDTWWPPKHGKIHISVDQFLSRSSNNAIIHFCVHECQRITYCNNSHVPAIFSFLCGKKNNMFKYFSTPESVTINANNALHFYFTDENNREIMVDTPIVRFKIIYE